MSNQTVEFLSSSDKPEEPQLTIQEKEQLLGDVSYGLLEELDRLTDDDRQCIHDGEIISQPIKSARLLWAITNRSAKSGQCIDDIFHEFGRRVKYLLSYEVYTDERIPTYLLYIELAPDKDFINFKKDEVKEEIVEAVTERPKTMAAHG